MIISVFIKLSGRIRRLIGISNRNKSLRLTNAESLRLLKIKGNTVIRILKK